MGFLNSKRFAGYAPATQRNWGRELRHLSAPEPQGLGSISVFEVWPRLVQDYLDGLADKPGTQELAYKALKAAETWAAVHCPLPRDITRGVEIIGSREGHHPWKDAHVELGERYATRGFSRVVTLAANTGQRGSDIVRMRWTDIETINGRPGINVVQQKTGVRLWVPFTQTLIGKMEGWAREPGFIVRRDKGTPWTRERMSVEWAEVRRIVPELAPLEALKLCLHGLRATACVRLSQAGCNTRQIADCVGMSEQMVARYTRHSEQRENAMAAIVNLEQFRGSQVLKKT